MTETGSTSKAEKRTLMKDRQQSLPGRRWARLLLWARHNKLEGKAELLLAILAVVSATSTYFALTRDSAPLEATSGSTIQILLRINGILLIALVAILGRWFIRLWLARRSNAPGSRLHTRVTGVFITIAVVPPIIMAVFSALFLEFGIQTWFSENVRTTLNSSRKVADAYVLEHRTSMTKDLAAISLAFNRLSPLQQNNPDALQKVAQSALSVRLLSELLIIEERDGEGSVLARSSQNLNLLTSRIETRLINRAKEGETVVVFSEADDTVVGIIKLTGYFRPTYLYIARDVNPDVINYLQDIRTAITNYEELEGQRSEFQLQFNVVFVIVALLILLAAIWLGLRFSSRLVTPISDLVNAAERIGRGDLSARVQSLPRSDEIGSLSRAFNRMTDQLQSQRKELIRANATSEERRRFLEEVLGGVSAGVMGLTADETVFLSNRAACVLLGIPQSEIEGSKLRLMFPAFEDLIEKARAGLYAHGLESTAQGQVVVKPEGDAEMTLMVRIAATTGKNGALEGFVVTFDDLTDQLAHQRTAAWADVARRVAHEIKNPLTPIQLSAERLKRKYLDEITSDPAVFTRCTDTIIRQVGDLRRMVDEFSSFARMPAPVFRQVDLVDVIKQAAFMQSVAWPQIDIDTDIQLPANAHSLMVTCDDRLLSQALVNVIKNAAESVESRMADNGAADGLIEVILKASDGDKITIEVRDNGLGLPKEQKNRLMEPYVTTRQKGTGLGLAIVRKIFDDHGGSVSLSDGKLSGAIVKMSLSKSMLERRSRQTGLAAE